MAKKAEKDKEQKPKAEKAPKAAPRNADTPEQMLRVVRKKFDGERQYVTGEIVDVRSWPNADALLRGRYLRMLEFNEPVIEVGDRLWLSIEFAEAHLGKQMPAERASSQEEVKPGGSPQPPATTPSSGGGNGPEQMTKEDRPMGDETIPTPPDPDPSTEIQQDLEPLPDGYTLDPIGGDWWNVIRKDKPVNEQPIRGESNARAFALEHATAPKE